MQLTKARIQNYRSIIDTGWFNIESAKTIFVGPNEAGKSAVLQALMRLNPDESAPLDALHDMPRRFLNDLQTGLRSEASTEVVRGEFKLSKAELQQLQDKWPGAVGATAYTLWVKMNGERFHELTGAPPSPTLKDVKQELRRTARHVSSRVEGEEEDPSSAILEVLSEHSESTFVAGSIATSLAKALDKCGPFIDEDNDKESRRWNRLSNKVAVSKDQASALKWLGDQMPKFVYFSNYHRVRPKIHLRKLADRVKKRLLEDKRYDYGNLCLLKLLGIDIDNMATQGIETSIADDTTEEVARYARSREERMHRLNAASVELTKQVRRIWQDDDLELVIKADGQLLTVLVRDELGIEIELDQRSEGFQWCTSFWIVFAAEAREQLRNAILLLDEPGVSLHGLKQTGFRSTMTHLAEDNQLLFTTHSPFMVGPDELRLVRVVEMPDRETGTKVHNEPAANQGAALLPLQEALGYDLAHSMFTASRNLVLEGITDYWYLDAISALAEADGGAPRLHPKIVKHFAGGAGKVAYYATILHASGLKVAALLDSDGQGDAAAKQEGLINLGNKNVLRTADFLSGQVKAPETEDLLRDTLLELAAAELGWDVQKNAAQQPSRPLVDILQQHFPKKFSKAQLAKAFVRWAQTHSFADLHRDEQNAWDKLVTRVNRRLK